MARLLLAHWAAKNMQIERAAKVSAIPIGAPDQSSRPNTIRYRIPIASIIWESLIRDRCAVLFPCAKNLSLLTRLAQALFFAGLLYDLVGAQQDQRRDRQAERLGGPQVEHKFERGRPLRREF